MSHSEALEVVSRMLQLREVAHPRREAALAHVGHCSRCRDALRLLSGNALRALAPAGLPELPPPPPRLPRPADAELRPWFLRLGDRLDLEPWPRALGLFVVLGAALTGLNVALASAFDTASAPATDQRQVVFYPLSFAYILAGVSLIVGRQGRAMRDLCLRHAYLADDEPRLSAALDRYPRRGLWSALAIGLLTALLGAEGAADRVSRSLADPGGLGSLLVLEGLLLWGLAAPAMYVVARNAWLLYRLGEDVELDLDHLERVEPFGDAALWAGGVLCGWPLLLLTLLGYGADPWVLPAAGALASGFIALVVLGSAWSVHARIRDLRRLEPFRAGREPLGDDRPDVAQPGQGLAATLRAWPYPLWQAAAVSAVPLVGLSLAAALLQVPL